MSSFPELIHNAVSWEIELTTRCNSRCVGCSRQSEYYYPNPHFNPRVDLDFNVLKKALASTPKNDFILFCGVYGDPLLHPQILEIFQHVREAHGALKMSVHTNGAFGSQEFWAQMAEFFKTTGSHVKFSIDGLQASHEAFRRGTQWNAVIKNAESFIAAGGHAVWKMIEFDHNQSEIAAARALSEKMGFRKFELRKNNFPGLDGPILQEVNLKEVPSQVKGEKLSLPELENWNLAQIESQKFDSISCRSLDRKNIYLDAHGKVWPCCWVGGLPYRPEHSLRQWMENKILSRYEQDFNSLHAYSLDEILKHSWMKSDLPASWKNTGSEAVNPMISTCAKTCGVGTGCQGT